LLDLQDYDARIIELTTKLKDLPRRLEEMSSDIQQLERVVEEERAELEQQDRWKAEKEEELKFIEAQIARIRQQMQGTRVHKEAMALQRQLDASRKQSSELEDEILQTMTAVDARRTAVEEHEGSLEALKQQLATEEEEIKTEMGKIEGELGEVTAERDGKSDGLDRMVKRRYTALAARRHPSMVEALDGRCTGCNMSLPPQLYNTLYYANSMESCPQCQRMIFLKSAVFGEDEEPGGT
jgi:predicted  nucleic acid-binding Zn-ribbon protein